MPDPERIANDIANTEARLEGETNSQTAESIQNEIHGMQVEMQHEIAQSVGDDWDPADSQ